MPQATKRIRCSDLKITDYPAELVAFEQDMADDIQKFMGIFLSWLPIGYGHLADDKQERTYQSTEQRRKALVKIKNQETLGLIDRFIDTILHKGNDASSSYGFFYADYGQAASTGKAKFKSQFVNLIIEGNNDKIKDSLEKNPNLAKIPLKQWKRLGFRKGDDAHNKIVWKEKVASIAANPDRGVSKQLREKLKLKCKRPHDRSYCILLMDVLIRQLRFQYEKYNVHIQDTADLEAQFAKQKTPLVELLIQFGDELYEANYGLSKYVLKNAIREIKSTEGSNVQIAIDTLKQSKYQAIIDAPYKDLMKAYDAWKLHLRLKKRKLYPTYPNLESRHRISFGLTGRGGFDIRCENNAIKVRIGQIEVTCSRSHYFGELHITPSTNCFLIDFAHKSKDKKGVLGNHIRGTVREIGLQKKLGGYYITVAYEVDVVSQHHELAQFFRKSEPESKDLHKLPSEFVAMAVDLNITNPITSTIAKVGKKIKGEIQALDYGWANLVESPKILASSGPRCSMLSKIGLDLRQLKGAIREYKAAKTKGEEISEKTKTWLLAQRGKKSESTRYLIQLKLATLNQKLKKVHFEMRKEGYNNLGEMIRLLDAKDQFASVIDSYERIHLKANETLPKVAKFDERRANFRQLVSRRFGAIIAKYAVEKQVNLVFVEDLETEFDGDNDNNSLSRIFAASSLLKCIEEALNKVQIEMVAVDKRGTSRTDPVSGLPTIRDEYNKCRSYAKRGNKIGVFDCDQAASLNVMIRGLGHSVVPYKFTAFDKDQFKKKGKETFIGKRLERSLKMKFGFSKGYFVEKGDEVVLMKRKPAKGVLHRTTIYWTPTSLITEDQQMARRKALEKEIKDLRGTKLKFDEFDLSPNGQKVYKAFSIDKILD